MSGQRLGIFPDGEEPMRKRRATITKAATAEGTFERKSGNRDHYGRVVLRLEPSGKGQGIEILSEVSPTVLPERCVESVREGVRRALQGGVTIGNPAVDDHAVVGVVVRIVDGTFRDDDCSDIAFKMAGVFAIRKALKVAEPIELP